MDRASQASEGVGAEQSEVDRLRELTDCLRGAAARLREGELEPEQASALVGECAAIAGKATGELERRMRPAAGRLPGQDTLL